MPARRRLISFLADVRRVGDGGGTGAFQVDPAGLVNGVVALGAVLVDQRTTVHAAVLGDGGLREQAMPASMRMPREAACNSV